MYTIGMNMQNWDEVGNRYAHLTKDDGHMAT